MKRCLTPLLFIFCAAFASAQTITITSPAEGASFSDPGSVTITWNTSGISAGNVGIEYSMDGGNTWSFQFSRAYNLGTVNWTSPDLPTGLSGSGILRIYWTTDASVKDENAFTISSSNPRSQSITSPTTSTTLTGAENINIDFTYANWGATDYVTFSYSLDGTTYHSFPLQQLSSASGTKSVSWQVYDRVTTQLYLRVRGYDDNSVFVTTSGPYTINAPTPWGYEFTTPIAGQTIQVNAATTVTWNNLNLSDAPSGAKSVAFEFSYNGGTNWNYIGGEPDYVSQTGATGSVSWTPTQSSTNCKIRLTTIDGVLQTTMGPFSVAASIPNAVVISEPVGTEEKKFGGTQSVKWLNTGTFSTNDIYYLYYSKDGGTFTNIGSYYGYQFTSSGNYMSHDWTIPDFGNDADSQVKIRVWNQTRNVSDTSTAFRVYYQPSVSVTSPVSTDELKFSTSKVISWNNGDRTTNDIYYLYYSKDGAAFTNIGSFYGYQFTASGNSLSYTWTVPDFGNDADSQVKIRVWNQTRNVSDTSDAFRVYYQPSVSITTPISTDQVKFSTSKVVSWNNGDRTTNDIYYLYYSKDGAAFTNIGSFYGYQFTSSGNSLSYTWTIPDFGNDADSQVKIRVWNQTRNVSDTSDAFRVYYQPSVSITAPVSTDQVKFSTSKVISWNNGDRTTNDIYYLYYSKDGAAFTNIGSFYGYQFTATDNSLSYNWTVPDFGNDADSQVKIRVWNQTRNVSDTSDAFRVYYQPSVVIRSPATGENVLASGQKTVTWENGDRTTSDIYYLYYSVNGAAFTNIGAFYGYQFTAYGDSLSYNWTVPNTQSTNVKMRVWNQTRNVSDTTLSFTICSSCPVFTVVTPNGGETYSPGQSVQVSWTLGSTWEQSDQISIAYSSDGGVTYTGSIYSGAYSGITGNAFTWTIPGIQGTTFRVRVQNVTKGYTETSDANFTISSTMQVPASFFAQQNANGSLTFTWQDTNTAETGYRIEYSTNRTTWTAYETTAQNATTYTTQIFNSGAAYWWRVVAVGTASTAGSAIRYGGNISGAGNSLRFDGVDDYVTLEDSTLLDFGTGNFTAEVWFKTANSTTSQSLINTYNGSISAYFVLFVQSGQMRAAIASNTYEVATPTLIQNDTWYHAALVRNGDNAMIYVNGIIQATVSGFSARNASSSGPISLGRQGSSNNSYLNGEMDEVRIWNTARTATEINDNYRKVLAGNESGLLAYYRFDQTSTETKLADYAPYNFLGTWNGSTGGTTAPQWQSSGAHTVVNPAISVTAPNGGESFQIGTTVSVTFTTTDIANADLMYLDYSADGGSNWTNIKSQARSAGTTITWPTGSTTGLTSGANYRVRVRNESGSVSDASDGSFTLTPAGVVTVTSPNGGEVWKGNTVHKITWTAENIASTNSIEIRLSTNGGTSYSIINDGTFGTYPSNSYDWTVPDSETTLARIQIVNTTLGVSDASDANFTIGKAADVTSPQFSAQPTASISGRAFTTSVRVNEYSNVYLAVLEDGNAVPQAGQVKEAGTTAITGQVAAAKILYSLVNTDAPIAGEANFSPGSLYDFYFVAEDTSGNIGSVATVQNLLRSCNAIECDTAALARLYNEMKADTWKTVPNWKTTTNVSNWNLITVNQTNGRVTELLFSDLGLTGTLSAQVLKLDSLRKIDVSKNALTGLPTLTPLAKLTSTNVSENLLQFDDLEPNRTLTGLTYSPQKKFDTPVQVTLPKGENYQRSVSVGGSQNSYSWKLINDSLSTITVAGLTSNQLVIQSINFANMGRYSAIVTSPLLPNLTLESAPFDILATSDLVFTALGRDEVLLTEGIGHALKIIGKGVPFDSAQTVEVAEGQFFFDNLVLGDYMIAAQSDPDEYIPTYYRNTYLWEEADTLRLRGDQTGQLRMTAIPGPTDGDNEVAGTVESDFEDEEDGGRLLARKKVAKAGCSMRKFKGSGRTGQDEDLWELIAYVQTNDEGQFVFEALPDGLYRFNIEYPGIPMDPNSFVEFEIGAGVDGSELILEAYVTEDGISVVQVNQLGFFKKVVADVNVYPNPASDLVIVELANVGFEKGAVRLMDLQGRVLREIRITDSNQEIQFDLQSLVNGTYLLNVVNLESASNAILGYKIIVRH